MSLLNTHIKHSACYMNILWHVPRKRHCQGGVFLSDFFSTLLEYLKDSGSQLGRLYRIKLWVDLLFLKPDFRCSVSSSYVFELLTVNHGFFFTSLRILCCAFILPWRPPLRRTRVVFWVFSEQDKWNKAVSNSMVKPSPHPGFVE